MQLQVGHQILRDRLVCEINKDSIQKRLSVANLTYESAVKKSLAMEAAMQNTKEMQASKKDEVGVRDKQVHLVQQWHSEET